MKGPGQYMKGLLLRKDMRYAWVCWCVTICFLGWVWVGLEACGGEKPNPSEEGASVPDSSVADTQLPVDSGPPPEPPIKYEPAHLQPSKFTTLKLDSQAWPLPGTLSKDKSLSIAIVGNEIWFGGKNGLYRFSAGKFEEIDTTPVVGLVAWSSSGKDAQLLVAHATRLMLWDQELLPSSLNSEFVGATLTTLFARGGKDLWIGTDKGLWRYQNEMLSKFEELKGVTRIIALKDSKELIVQESSGQVKALREEQSGDWSLRVFGADSSLNLSQVTPISSDEFWGVKDGLLYLRKKNGEQVAWWPFIIQPDLHADEKGNIPQIDPKWHVSLLLLDEVTGTSWAITQEKIAHLGVDEVKHLAIPQPLTTVSFATITSDGSLWVSDGTQIVRVGHQQKPLTYNEDIKSFVEKNCTECHKPGGSAAHFPLVAYQQVKENVNKMLTRIDNKTMPPPPRQLVGGDAELLRQWIKDGLQE